MKNKKQKQIPNENDSSNGYENRKVMNRRRKVKRRRERERELKYFIFKASVKL